MRSLLVVLALFIASPAYALLASISPGVPPGWSSSGVPRNTGDATDTFAPLPDQLLTAQPTYFNWSVFQNPALVGTWQDELYLDDELIQLVTRSNGTFAARFWNQLNTGPILVPGGRHSVEVWVDRLRQTNEEYDNRYDDDWTGQYLWQPQPIPANTAYTTRLPQGEGNTPNVNAFAFTRAPGTAWVISGGAAGVTTPVVVYDDYVNSTTGLSHLLSESAHEGGLTNYVVGSSAAAATLYPGIFRAPGSPITYAGFAVADASGRASGSGAASWPSVNQPANMLAQVFTAQLTAGDGEVVTLTRFMGVSDLEVRVFPPGVTAAALESAPWVSTPRGGDDEYDDLVFTPAVTGTYLVVVSRVDASHIGEACGYALDLNLLGTVGLPVAFTAAPLTVAPSPAAGPVRLSFTLAAPTRASLVLYDVKGRMVRRLVDGDLPAGPHTFTWDGAPGRYFARLVAGSRSENLAIVRL